MKTGLQIIRLNFAIGFILAISSFLYFRYAIPYHVCFKEQIQLFVFSSSYVLSYFSKPAVLACLAGDFLTQFLYFKGTGAAVITLMLVAEWQLIYLTLKRFSVASHRAAFSAILPVMIEWMLLPHFSFSLSLSVSFILALSTFIVYAKMKKKATVAVSIILIPLLYVIVGASVFLFLILVVLYEIHRKRKMKNREWIMTCFQFAILLTLSLLLPFLLRHTYLLTLKQAFFYPFPGFMQGLSLVALAFIVLLFVCFKKLHEQNAGALYLVVTFFVLFFLWIAGLVKTTDRKQENIFGMATEAYHNQWDKVVEIAESTEMKSPIAAYYTNLALSQKDLLGERLMDFYQPFTSGLLIPIVPSSNWFAIFLGNDGYYHIGDMDMAQHAAMLGMIFSPRQRSARLTERLAEINMAIGDMPVATKYMRILESTLFHKFRPDSLNAKPHRGIFNKDVIRSSTDIKTSLELLAESDPENLPAINYLLCYYLLNKNIPAFFKAYTSYYKEKYTLAPKVYAEALLIYFAVAKSSVEEVQSYGIHPDIIRSFGEYTRLYESSGGSLTPVQERFPNTYWLFYHFATVEE